MNSLLAVDSPIAVVGRTRMSLGWLALWREKESEPPHRAQWRVELHGSVRSRDRSLRVLWVRRGEYKRGEVEAAITGEDPSSRTDMFPDNETELSGVKWWGRRSLMNFQFSPCMHRTSPFYASTFEVRVPTQFVSLSPSHTQAKALSKTLNR